MSADAAENAATREAELVAALADANAANEVLAKRLHDIYRSGFDVRWFTPIEHVAGCECEYADPYTIEEVDNDCTSDGDGYPMLVLDDGSYTVWGMRLDQARTLIMDRLADHPDGQVPLCVDEQGDVTYVVKMA